MQQLQLLGPEEDATSEGELRTLTVSALREMDACDIAPVQCLTCL